MTDIARRILVPIDFERGSRRALRYARAIASMSKGQICLLHIVPMPAGRDASQSDRWWIDLAERTLSGLAERAHLPPGTETRVLSGPVAPLIGKYACEHKFDLVILGGRSQPDWHGSYLGSTAAAIVRQCRVPLLIIPAARVAKQAAAEHNRQTAAAGTGARRPA